jgi:hypothetical protein
MPLHIYQLLSSKWACSLSMGILVSLTLSSAMAMPAGDDEYIYTPPVIRAQPARIEASYETLKMPAPGIEGPVNAGLSRQWPRRWPPLADQALH